MPTALDFENKVTAARVWHRVFLSTDPFGWPFSPTLGYGRVLFPTDGCHLSRDQFNALAQVAAQIGETHCYLAVVEGSTSRGVTTNDDIVQIDLTNYDDYSTLHLTLENALYSMNSTWGLLLSHEMHAVFGGSTEIVSAFNRADGQGAEEWQSFQTQWKAEAHTKWLAEIASHLKLG